MQFKLKVNLCICVIITNKTSNQVFNNTKIKQSSDTWHHQSIQLIPAFITFGSPKYI